MKEILSERGLILCGCGKMGTALLNGWKSAGIDLKKISVLEPNPSPWLYSLMNTGLKLNHLPIEGPQICILAVKPQMTRQPNRLIHILRCRQHGSGVLCIDNKQSAAL